MLELFHGFTDRDCEWLLADAEAIQRAGVRPDEKFYVNSYYGGGYECLTPAYFADLDTENFQYTIQEIIDGIKERQRGR